MATALLFTRVLLWFHIQLTCQYQFIPVVEELYAHCRSGLMMNVFFASSSNSYCHNAVTVHNYHQVVFVHVICIMNSLSPSQEFAASSQAYSVMPAKPCSVETSCNAPHCNVNVIAHVSKEVSYYSVLMLCACGADLNCHRARSTRSVGILVGGEGLPLVVFGSVIGVVAGCQPHAHPKAEGFPIVFDAARSSSSTAKGRAPGCCRSSLLHTESMPSHSHHV